MAPIAQTNWRFCGNCFGLWFNGQPTNGHCPAPNAPGGAHISTGSGDYLLIGDPDGNFND